MNSELRKQFHHAYIAGDKKEIGELSRQDISNLDRVIKFCNGSYKEDGENPYLDALRKKTLWLSSPKAFNDPFDCAMNIDYTEEIRECGTPILKDMFEDRMEEFLDRPGTQQALNAGGEKVNADPKLKKRNQELRDSIFVSCFSEKENLKSLRMWGHYANCHKGFCLEYDFGEIHGVYREGMIPILYKQSYSLKEPGGDAPAEDDRRFYLDVAFTKAQEWEYEKEWRCLKVDEHRRGKDGFSLPFIKPTSVYIGCKADVKLKNDLKEICAKQGIQLFQMKMKPGSFDLVCEKLSIT